MPNKNEDRLPPYSEEAERGVLGSCLLEPGESLNCCEERIGKQQVFYDLRHRTIWGVLTEMRDKQEAIDVITLQQKLKDRNLLEQVGGIAYLAQLQDGVPSAANLLAWLDVVLEKFLLRQLIVVCTNAVVTAFDPKDKAGDIVLRVEEEISRLTERYTVSSEEHIRHILTRNLAEMDEWSYHRGSQQLFGLPLGVPGNYLDKIIGGIRNDYYMVLAGRPGSGKTSMAINIAEFLSTDYLWFEDLPAKENEPENKVKHHGIPVGIFSIEMTAESLGYRLLFGRANVDMAQYRQGYKKKGDDEKLKEAALKLSASNIFVDATPAQSIGQIAAKARRMVKQHGIKLFILDYVQLVEMEGGSGFDRVREITKISRKIMALKKQLRVPWIVLAQMNRNIETAEREREPLLSDLKDCGALEQDCDVAVFTYRTPKRDLERGSPSQAQILSEVCGGWEWSERPYRVDIVVAKNRFGPTGKAQMVFCKNLCRFEDWHLWKVKHGVEKLKEGERDSALFPEKTANEKPDTDNQ